MAKPKSSRQRPPLKGDSDGLHAMPSGLYHTADSLAGGRHGTFVDRFGPPGDPERKASIANNGGGMDLGTAPSILKIQQAKKQTRIN